MVLSITATRAGPLLGLLRTELRLSATQVKRLKAENALFVNDRPVFTNHPVVPGDRVLVQLHAQPPAFPAQGGPLEVLYEDDCFLAADKPPGLLTHPSAARQTETLANFLLGYYASTGQQCSVHPVSRLDRDTFGVCLFAKHAHLHALCAGGLTKTYHATVWGGPPEKAGQILLPVARRGGGSLWREVRPDGQPAETSFQVLRRGGGLCLLALRPVTGRTHQLRLHCLASGFPILGDPVYQTESSADLSARLGLSHQQLLAHSLSFTHPLTGAAVQICSRQAVFWP